MKSPAMTLSLTLLGVLLTAATCAPADPLKYRVTPQMASALSAERAVTAKTLSGYVFEADRKRRLARAALEVALLRERMADHLLAVAVIRVKVLVGRGRMVAQRAPIQATGEDLKVAQRELALARLNRRYRGLYAEYARRQLRLAEAIYQKDRARHFEFVMESLQKEKHPSAVGRPLSPYIGQTGKRKMIMADALSGVEHMQREVRRLRPQVIGHWAPALVCPNRDVTRTHAADSDTTPAPRDRPATQPAPADKDPARPAAPAEKTAPRETPPTGSRDKL
jgi:hypothetical protein